MALLRQAWLFVRGDESIRITRRPPVTLLVYGPGSAQQSSDFDSAVSLEEFLQSYEQRLLSDGWVLAAVEDRRESERETPPGHERRAQGRPAKPPGRRSKAR